MNQNYTDALREHGESLITHIGLVDSTEVELSSANYARQPVTWTDEASSVMRPSSDRPFGITAGDQVAGWHGFDAATAGTDYGGETFPDGPFDYSQDGTFTLAASQTAVDHNNV